MKMKKMSNDCTVDWKKLPDDVIDRIMTQYKNKLRERMRNLSFYEDRRTFCEVCEKKKIHVLWFRHPFHHQRIPGGYSYKLYSACRKCIHVVPRNHPGNCGS